MANEKRLIDAEALIAELHHKQERYLDSHSVYEDAVYIGLGKAIIEVNYAPTVVTDVVTHAQWIVAKKCNHVPYRIKKPEKWVTYACSECGYSNGRKQSNYCPSCGAKMDGDVNE